MTRRVNRWAAPAAVLAMLAGAILQAAEQPANVPTYNGKKPAEKQLPPNVPVYRQQAAADTAAEPSVKLTRRRLNAPRPGVAIPDPPERRDVPQAPDKPQEQTSAKS